MNPGDLVYVYILGEKRVGIVERMDPSKPDPFGGDWTREDYYWIVIPSTGDRKWIKGTELEVICDE